ncbi:MAG: Abortive infection protein, partial [Nocardioidaceae bacterium]|nr:Abortive infection protein [Nocardioidaceae bacterium]
GTFLPGDPNDIAGGANKVTGTLLAMAFVVALTTPLQAMGEEYVFRGYLLQAVGSMFKRWTSVASAASLLATALLFAAFHGTQNFPLFFDRFAFGVLAAYLVVKVGGLEGGIALHVVNNFFAYGFALLFGDISSSLNTTETSWWNVPVTVVQSVFYLVAVLSVARRMGLRGETAPAPAPIGDARA